jgi:hypothetical protein
VLGSLAKRSGRTTVAHTDHPVGVGHGCPR